MSRVNDDYYYPKSTRTYSYDERGNVLSKNVYDYTKNETITSSPNETTVFEYANNGWQDQLTSVNGVTLTYDANGNVLTYGDKSYTWINGRNLEGIADGENVYSYTYDENGIRASKTVNGVTTYFNTKDGVILSQTDGTNTMYFQYDSYGTPIGFIYNGNQYFYLTNQMGDVFAIAHSDGTLIAEYIYDEWGKVIDTYMMVEDNKEWTEAVNANPLRYRGYYYDSETGYYYLQSRYYDPGICRFINSDILEIAQVSKEISSGVNLFNYCNNSPLNYCDPFGYWVGFLGISVNAVLCWGISGMIGLFFDGKTFAFIFSASYKTIGIGLSAGICGGFYPQYKNVDEFYKDKLGTISLFFLDFFMQSKGVNGKITGIGITISIAGASICSVSVPTYSKMYKINLEKTKSYIKSFVTKKESKKVKVSAIIKIKR